MLSQQEIKEFFRQYNQDIKDGKIDVSRFDRHNRANPNNKVKLYPTICYRTKTGETFLSRFCYLPKEDVEKEVEILNTTKPKAFKDGEIIDWDNIKEFFVNMQEEMY